MICEKNEKKKKLQLVGSEKVFFCFKMREETLERGGKKNTKRTKTAAVMKVWEYLQ